jgi:hypothetical protein
MDSMGIAVTTTSAPEAGFYVEAALAGGEFHMVFANGGTHDRSHGPLLIEYLQHTFCSS